MTSHSARDILRCHYGVLSQSLQYPIRVSHQLYQEGVISMRTLNNIKSTAQSFSEEKATSLLLQAVRHAVHINYHDLEVFASVLLKFNSNVPCAKAILRDCGKYVIYSVTLYCYVYEIIIEKAFPNDDIPEVHSSSSIGEISEGKTTYLQLLDNLLTHIASVSVNSSSTLSPLPGLYM